MNKATKVILAETTLEETFLKGMALAAEVIKGAKMPDGTSAELAIGNAMTSYRQQADTAAAIKAGRSGYLQADEHAECSRPPAEPIQWKARIKKDSAKSKCMTCRKYIKPRKDCPDCGGKGYVRCEVIVTSWTWFDARQQAASMLDCGLDELVVSKAA